MQSNDIVMKVHQNRNMNYDEMHEYEMFNGAAQPARGIVCVNIIYVNICLLAHKSVMLAFRISCIILAAHSIFPLLK